MWLSLNGFRYQGAPLNTADNAEKIKSLEVVRTMLDFAERVTNKLFLSNNTKVVAKRNMITVYIANSNDYCYLFLKVIPVL